MLLKNGLVWFGAAISLAEIMTGAYLGPLGLAEGLLAIVLGHVIGFLILLGVGYISARENKSAMETVSLAFGHRGMRFFALANVVQLVGWTAIMIYDGSLAANQLLAWGMEIWSLIIGLGILAWLYICRKGIMVLQVLSMALLFALTIVLAYSLPSQSLPMGGDTSSLSFPAALELSVAMPLSWLPLLGDYLLKQDRPFLSTLTSAGVYSLASIFMYYIGLASAIFVGNSDIGLIMGNAGLGLFGILIIFLSTITTTYLDAFSAGTSWQALFNKGNAFTISCLVTVAGAVAAALYPMDDIIDFLYLIGSIFGPMAIVLILRYWVYKDLVSGKSYLSFVAWGLGCISYHYFLQTGFSYGATLPAMVVTGVPYLLVTLTSRKHLLGH